MKQKTRKHLPIHIVLILGSFIMILPFAWMFLTAFKTQNEAIHVPPIIFPTHWDLDAFANVFDTLPFFSAYVNTIISAIVTVIAAVSVDSENGAAEYDSGFVYTEPVFGLRNIPDETVFHVTATGIGGCSETGWM